ncbi:30S ribosomal protein S3 [Christensenellaceae bacterium NSJ-44]|jgi:small subunit ribosomal protein S3|uniref:Small ribosomal subunit protein uS3 n=1 Tax=Luoshenia tenuis TaxID=2763654 RepID=A0A926HNN5_9FIRM|nr:MULTISPECIES: 30S ribosomal protein S3 [Clostridia]MBC8529850.1 30S ribosomal protein S3 [Luoshenia tenuis]SCJ64751.1 BS2 [uncultured Clostridium sp.]
MGQKVHPHGLRVGVIKNWDTRWFADSKKFADNLIEDYKLREFLKERLFAAGISKIEIERAATKISANIYTAKPGIIIGRGGSGVDATRKAVEKYIGKPVHLNIVEVKNPDTDAQLVAENIAAQLERRISFRRAMKSTLGRAMKAGAKGIKTKVSGRLGGADIARSEGYHDGSVPLQTLRADIDYGFAEAKTTYGRIGVKVWIYKGEVLPAKKAVKPNAQGGKA